MQENYSSLVSPILLAKWQREPLNAPGRMLSNPLPDHLEILTINNTSENVYEVKAEIIETTSTEKINGGIIAKRPITIVVKKIENLWLIDTVTLGKYEENNSTIYKNTQYVFNFSSPENWKNYTIITDEWKGFPLNRQSNEAIETGPIISIRHPQWTNVRTYPSWCLLYVFALPARYNYAFLTGFEDVEDILAENPLQPLNQ